jgi:hypothetical protein
MFSYFWKYIDRGQSDESINTCIDWYKKTPIILSWYRIIWKVWFLNLWHHSYFEENK